MTIEINDTMASLPCSMCGEHMMLYRDRYEAARTETAPPWDELPALVDGRGRENQMLLCTRCTQLVMDEDPDFRIDAPNLFPTPLNWRGE